MKEQNNNIATYGGIITATLTGFFGTINLSIDKSSPILTISLFGIMICSVFFLAVFYYLKKNNSRYSGSSVETLISIQKEIDHLQLKGIKERQFIIADNLIFKLNRSLLNYFKESFTDYHNDNKITLPDNIEKTEAFLFYKDILEDIAAENKKILKETIDRNNFDKVNDKEFSIYTKEKVSIFLATADEILNRRYCNDICIIPLPYFMNKNQMQMNDLCITELTNVLNQIRKITINEYEKINGLQNKMEEMKKVIAKSRD